ncbi:tRNA (adenosine(37)-N6)-threonylcarbamoyltransferase complex dimerization subunit type 1 TsaB [uncultured Methylibium sp.]|uniref:tRNA (adenosine(37)-N6)-threonylcarbamoyltransferase complex dimerization subunit type 1 TsaB n=1 Tax=uncultured Methylibium sp. TaxID=381093 RepID=UPI0025E8BA40|nr:tRNA (adenosine(37)-N6)-threonylcarbamoyltransferase complex dimerization subunit type 1 TsaB [uncultured Methylibium sp.]
MNPTLLALDTGTEVLHLGACRGDRSWQRALPGGARASADLLPALMSLLDEAGLALRDLDAIAFGRGPGAFTGVRAACAVTQGLAFGAGRPVLSLDSLMAVAEDARTQGAGDELWVAVDARMGEAYAARYRHGPEGWRTIDAPSLHDPVTLAQHAAAETPAPQVAGSSLSAHAAAWTACGGPRWPDAGPRAGALLALARAAWARGEAVDAARALPLYVRDKVAQTTAERAAAALERRA